ncbi:Helix-turn-helix domain-containing protein [Reichenbachiella faecimaris]|uniref:Helix-turn-helix domain-containing protein n=1 Tax=Reichenbachiella faecimaris TaxID=692418 RepID=A0A1W2GP20_REIFA|nr:helix-turn-helix domain-containing protein [Reichenbachiella faecimaris]SMD38395.1 Helix-turn-helix domain-containing protein [Reichenbachiella faecimaris]
MNYQIFEPNADLATFVKCYWTLESPKKSSPEKQTIVPDGCMEMIFHYGDLYKQYLPNGESIIQPRCFVFGQLTQPLEIEPTGATGIFSIRFHPEGFLPFATIPIKEMEKKATSFKTLFGREGLTLEEKVLKAKSTAERINHVENFLIARLADAKIITGIVKSTVDLIIDSKGQLSVGAVSQQVDISRRQLERNFSSTIGLSPKQLSKTIRLQAILKKLLNQKGKKLTALAYDGKYYDQAHFIKDFKEFTGITPKEFYGENLKMSKLFYEG